jgi:DNA-binding NarL/FixJ family response regulator
VTPVAETSRAVVRVVVADDQTLFRSGLAHLLNESPDIQVVGEAADGQQAIDLVRKLKPNVVLMDLKMPRVDGIEATRRIVAEYPDVKVLVLTTFDIDSYVLQALRVGANGYVLKDSTPESVVRSILTVMAGDRVMASAVANRVIDLVTGNSTSKDFYDGLTMREIDILKMIAKGMANKQIAFRLKISEKTVRNHITAIYEKLDIYDRAQAAIYAVRKGLIDV